MHAGHHHDHHGHHHGPTTAKVLRWSLVITVVYILLLVVAGFRAHSLALLSEAGHNVSDFLALLLSYVAVYLQQRPPTQTKTFGYHRAEVVAAFLNAASLILIALLITYEAIQRLYHPEPVQAKLMIWVAVAGVVMNGTIAFMLMRAGRDLNVRSAIIHEIGDTLSTAAVILGGWIILYTGNTWIDPALSLVIGGLVLWSSFGIIRESLNILLEGIPRGMKLETIADEMKGIGGVLDVHDLHVWSIGSSSHALSAHVTIADIPPSESDKILANIRATLAKSFHIHHTTVQFESADCDIAHGCVIPVHGEHGHTH
jgi:cobalt-zinc-cadmium efflux system protein